MDAETKQALESLNNKIKEIETAMDRLIAYTNNLAVLVRGLDKQAKLIKRNRPYETTSAD